MLIGSLICFLGYRLIYLIIGLCGFIVVTSSSFLLLGGYTTHIFPFTIILSLFLGLIGGILAIFFYKSGVFLLGVIGGFSFGIITLPVINTPIILLLLGIAGGFLSLVVEKILIIIATASIGSLVIVWALVRLFEFIDILKITPDFEPSYFQMVCILTWLGLTLIGFAVQYKYSKVKIRKRKTTSSGKKSA